MKRCGIVTALPMVMLLVAPPSLHAQQLDATRVGITEGSAAPRHAPRVHVAADSTSNLGWHVIGGAMLGAGAAGLWYVHEASQIDDAMPLYVGPVIGIGAALGALTGWAVGESVEHHGR